jgi:hypothetical protein
MSCLNRALPLLPAVPLWSQDTAAFEPLRAGEYFRHLTPAGVTVAAEPSTGPHPAGDPALCQPEDLNP